MKANGLPGLEVEETIKVLESGGTSNVLVNGRSYMTWDTGDEGSRRMAIVQLYVGGLGQQENLARVFGVHVNSVQKYIADFTEQGLAGLITRPVGPKAKWKITPEMRGKILVIVLNEKICELEAIQRQLKEIWHKEVSLPSISQVLAENGLSKGKTIAEDIELTSEDLFCDARAGRFEFNFNGAGKIDCEVVSETTRGKDHDADEGKDEGCGLVFKTRTRDEYSQRQRIYLDVLEHGDYNAYAGGLLFAPLLKRGSFLPVLRSVINIPTCHGYSLEELCLTLFYFDVFGFQSMEDFKRAYADEFGLLIGRSKSPSHFTLRRFLHEVRRLGKSEELIDEFAGGYLKDGLASWGVIYIDGHFLPYYGVYPITKGWHGVRKIPMKGSYNFLVADEKFKPWLFLIRSSSEDLLEKIPELIEKAKKIGLRAGLSRERVDNLVVLFDREGYSAELYRYLDGKDGRAEKRRAIFISWAKYADRWVDDLKEELFDKNTAVAFEIKEPEKIQYFESERIMNKYGKMRVIVIQSGRDKQRAAIYTNGTKEEIQAERIVQLMCRRWGEENLIKELMLKHKINYTPGYVMQDLDEQPLTDNPEVKELRKKREALTRDLHKLKIELADHLLDKKLRDHQDKEKRKGEILENIARLNNDILLTQSAIDKLPKQVRFDEAHDGEKLLSLNYEKKRFLDCIKVFAYNLKDEMCRLLLKHYGNRKNEILPALAMIIERGGHVKIENGRVIVRLRGFRNREIDYAARHLCEDLNEMRPTTLDNYEFPMRYEVQ